MQSNTGGGHGSPKSSASQPSQRNLSDPIVRERRLAELTASMRQWQHDHLSRGYNTVMANAWHTGTAEIAVRTSSEQRRASAASANGGSCYPATLVPSLARGSPLNDTGQLWFAESATTRIIINPRYPAEETPQGHGVLEEALTPVTIYSKIRCTAVGLSFSRRTSIVCTNTCCHSK